MWKGESIGVHCRNTGKTNKNKSHGLYPWEGEGEGKWEWEEPERAIRPLRDRSARSGKKSSRAPPRTKLGPRYRLVAMA